MPLGERERHHAHEGESQVRGERQLGVKPPAARGTQMRGDVHDHREPDGANGGTQDDGDQHPPVGNVGCEPSGQDDESGVVENGDRHKQSIPDGAHGVEAQGQEDLHGEGGRDHGLEESGDLSHGSGLVLLRGEHPLGQAEVARHRETEDRREVMTPRPPTTMPKAMTA